jgi:hypothetical protein
MKPSEEKQKLVERLPLWQLAEALGCRRVR